MKKLMYLLLAMPLLFCACGDDDSYETDKLIKVFEENLNGYTNKYVNEQDYMSKIYDLEKELEKAIEKGEKDREKELKDRIQHNEENREAAKIEKKKYYAMLAEQFPKLIDSAEKYASKRWHYTFTIPINPSYSKILKKEAEDMKEAMIERIRNGDY